MLLQKERNRNDKLLMAYTQLKTRYAALKEQIDKQDHPDSDAAENSDSIETLQSDKASIRLSENL
ncbi:MAG: hypothetical protein U5R30_21865 [Deltaproteobacteria bacterium]|nr:hypothetical protein [Deltaproteobacteria bacterium]